jgi:hypothetical protein
VLSAMGGVPTRGMEDVVRTGLKQQLCCTGEWIVAGESNLAHRSDTPEVTNSAACDVSGAGMVHFLLRLRASWKWAKCWIA